MEIMENNSFKQNWHYVNNEYKSNMNANINVLVKKFNYNKENCLDNFNFENFYCKIVYDFYKINNIMYNHNSYIFSKFEKLFSIMDIENFIIKIKSYNKINYDLVIDILLKDFYLIISNNPYFYRIRFNYNRNFYKYDNISNYLFPYLLE